MTEFGHTNLLDKMSALVAAFNDELRTEFGRANLLDIMSALVAVFQIAPLDQHTASHGDLSSRHNSKTDKTSCLEIP